jgi:hypothetical protein
LAAIMFDLEEGEGGCGGLWDEDLARELGCVLSGIWVLISQSDLSARVSPIGINVVREIICIRPCIMDAILKRVMLRSSVVVVALDAAIVLIEPYLCLPTPVISEVRSQSLSRPDECCDT